MDILKAFVLKNYGEEILMELKKPHSESVQKIKNDLKLDMDDKTIRKWIKNLPD